MAPGTSVFLSSETGMSGNILGHISVPSTNSDFKMERGTYFETLYWERASSHDDGGVSWFFSSGGARVGFLARNDEVIREPLVWRQGTQVSIRVARGSAALLSIHCRGIRPQDAMKGEFRGLSRVAAGNPGFPRLVPVTSGSFTGFL